MNKWSKWFWNLLGFQVKEPPYKDEPCLIVKYNGEVVTSTLRTFNCGKKVVKCRHDGWYIANKDGSINNYTYKSWFLARNQSSNTEQANSSQTT